MKRFVLVLISILLFMLIIPAFKTSADPTTIEINPTNSYVTLAKTLSVDVNVTAVTYLTAWQFTVYFDNTVLNCTGVTEGPFLKSGGGTYFGQTINNNYDSTHGSVQAYSTLLGNNNVNGSGVLATITFNATAVGSSTLHLSDTKLGDQNIPPLPITHTTIDGTAYVQAFTLTVTTSGSGSVTLNDSGPYYHTGEAVLLTAVPVIGWSFSSWSGGLTGSANPATLVMTGDSSVTATFTENQYTLTVTVTPGGSGSVTENPNEATYTYGTVVTLTAIPSLGYSFGSWGGDASGTANPTTVTVTGNMSVTATFIQNKCTLTLGVVGQGSVGVSPLGPYYNYGDVVTLTPSANPGWIFQYWSGDLSGSANPATLSMTGNFSVTAHFTEKPLLQINPTNRTCRMYNENFSVAIGISNALNVSDFAFEIHFNTTLLTYVSVTWNAWSSGTISVAGGVITGYTSGSPKNGTFTLVTIQFKATYNHVWKSGTVNDVSDTIFIQGANVSYPAGPDLRYVRSGLNQVDVGPDFVYTFSPIQGDVNNDGSVNIIDLRTVAAYFGVKSGDPSWFLAVTFDLDNSGVIDVFDLRIVAVNIPHTYVPPP